MSREGTIRFARRVFLLAGIVGLIEVTPLFFLAGMIGHRQPPPITHPEFYYGFVVIVLTWQIAFLIVARDPVRYQPLMPARRTTNTASNSTAPAASRRWFCTPTARTCP